MTPITNLLRFCVWNAGKLAAGVGLVGLGLATRSPAQTNIITDCTETALRSALAQGGTVCFACDGTITLTGTLNIASNTLLDGGSHRVTISGADAVRVLRVNPSIRFTVANLTIAHGRSDRGAGLYNDRGLVALSHCVFANNTVGAASSESALGGAVYNEGLLVAQGSLFYGNNASGGNGIDGATPAPTHEPADNPGSVGGAGGTACGGIFNGGTASLINCSFVGNYARGGRGGTGGNGGIIYIDVPITDPPTPPRWRYGTDGAGGAGGDSLAAIQDTSGVCFLTNCTFALNWCDPAGGLGGPGGMGDAIRGPGPPGANGNQVGGTSGGCHLVNTLLTANTPVNGGGLDLGHNLSSDGSSGFTHPASLNDTDPGLGPLADNGGPTPTLALLPGSPAINAADPAAAPPTDQRGFPRPVGPAPDIGAFEYGSPACLQLTLASQSDAVVNLSGVHGQPYSLLTSTNLTTWFLVATNQFGPDGTAVFHDDPVAPHRFFRLTLP